MSSSNFRKKDWCKYSNKCFSTTCSSLENLFMKSILNTHNNTAIMCELSQNLTYSKKKEFKAISTLRGVVVDSSDTKAKENFFDAAKKFESIIDDLKKIDEISKKYKKFQIDENSILFSNELQGIGQIHNAVINLVKQTHRNAMMASQYHNVAVDVSDENSCEYENNELKI